MPLKKTRTKPSLRAHKPKASGAKEPDRDDVILAKAREALKRITKGSKFSHRPYKPRKPKAKKPRSAESILQEARAARKALVRKGSTRTWARQASRREPAEAPIYQPPVRQPIVRPTPPPAHAAKSPPSRILPPILRPLGNPPVIGSGHGEQSTPPEVWAAEDFYVIVEASPKCVAPLAKEHFGFRYLVTASCFYRESRKPHAEPHPLLIFTLEHSALLEHTAPGLLARLVGERAKPVDMAVGMFTPTARLQLGTVDYDDDFIRGKFRLLKLAHHHLGLTAEFTYGGYLTKGNLLPAMR